MKIFLSASLPEYSTPLDEAVFETFLFVFGHCASAGGHTIVFGSHPSVTPTLTSVPGLSLEQHGLERFASSMLSTAGVTLHGSTDHTTLPADLATMRDAMVKDADMAVFIGGKLSGLGGKPGLLDEAERYADAHPNGTAHVVMSVGGAVRLLCGDNPMKPICGTMHIRHGPAEMIAKAILPAA